MALNPICFINGIEASLPEQVFLHFHGSSVFTTLRTQAQELLYWPKHWQRLSEHALALQYKMPDEHQVLTLIAEALRKLQCDLKVRVIVMESDFAITCEIFQTPLKHLYQGVFVHLSNQIVHTHFAHIKTGNSLPYQLAYKEALAHGAHEGLLTNTEGYVVDGSRTSLLLYDGTTLTALLGGLGGIMREIVLQRAQLLGLQVRRAYKKAHELDGQLLLTSSLQGLVPVGLPRDEVLLRLIKEFQPTD